MIELIKNKIIDSYHKIKKDLDSKLIIKNSILYLSIRGVGDLFGLLFTLMILNIYDETVLGNFIFGFGIVNFLLIISVFGFDLSILAHFPGRTSTNGERTDIFPFIFSASFSFIITGIILIITLVAPIRALVISYYEYYPVEFLYMLLFSLPALSLVKITAFYFRAQKNITAFAFFNNTVIYLFGVIILSFDYLVLESKLGPARSFIIAAYLGLFATAIYFFRVFEGIKAKYNKSELKKFLSNSFSNFISNLLDFLKDWFAIFAIGIILNGGEVGKFTLILKIATASGLVAIALHSFASPRYSEYHNLTDFKGLMSVIRKTAFLNFWLSMPVVIIGIPAFIFIADYSGLSSTELLFPFFILLSAQIIDNLGGASRFILQMIHQSKQHTRFNFFSICIFIPTLIILSGYLGLTGAALSILVLNIFFNLILILYIKKKVKINPIYFPKK
ncbi:MAG: hypothetical protein JXA99_04180 [Candidatus Lokiarchaeota archaeon]|nr:hypothetical protein [Candidatus Lokiarchaeota archaeon]